ncbi:hypothetical protein PEDI_14560 [Persicobacter diffluens]|uniref:Uncharacterized protein n=2 Tax=Persicobacter diffluens TaxID=981 RepID=A0AAN4VX81_9BACT|nr:hypothetical protein PEDI_14560 [Persicobacter diffluens]
MFALMKQLLTIFLIGNILLMSLSRIGVVFSYEMFQDYIAENWCENRDEPITVCYGSCFVRNSMELIDNFEHQTGQEGNAPAVKVITDFFVPASVPLIIPENTALLNIKHRNFYANFYQSVHTSSVFIPPCA